MGVRRGGSGLSPLDSEMWYFIINFWVKNVFPLVSELAKWNFITVTPPCKSPFGRPVEKSTIGPCLEKNHSDAHAGIRLRRFARAIVIAWRCRLVSKGVRSCLAGPHAKDPELYSTQVFTAPGAVRLWTNRCWRPACRSSSPACRRWSPLLASAPRSGRKRKSLRRWMRNHATIPKGFVSVFRFHRMRLSWHVI